MTQNTEPNTRPSKLSDTRPPSMNADEPTTLVAFLDYLREAVVAKVDGISDEDARRPGVASGTSLLWLVRHLTVVEHNWFVWAYQGVGEKPRESEAVPLDGATVAGEIAAYREAIARSNAVTADAPDLDRPGVRSLRPDAAEGPSLRWVLVHLIEETGRHAGHADIIREQLDGTVGR
ncbi:DinB family protein [Streptomyces sp. NRRL S-350]|uniref:DinB family protein n=1 Tax=Streptomyces sp. NRRL S-350 TaxID=1463902 RepID=UPI000A7C1CEB|nr:DinB family protein [Streptomyces sp. NRRL S-350]